MGRGGLLLLLAAACAAALADDIQPLEQGVMRPAPVPAPVSPAVPTPRLSTLPAPPAPAPLPAEVESLQLPAPVAAEVPEREVGRGLASWYGPRFHGRRTASGERFDQHAFTAAHRTLPFGTVVRVRSLVNGRTVEVRINDRGPFLKRRVIDLSRAAAEALGLLGSGKGVKPVVLLVPVNAPQ
jgi:rare lipoprotein A